MAEWIRTSGRDDYRGWILRLVGERAEIHVGKSLIECLIWWMAYKCGYLSETPICGRIHFAEVFYKCG